MKALLQVKRFKVLEMIYKSGLNTEFDDSLSPTFAISIGLNEKDIKEAIVNLTVEIGEEIDENYLRVEIAG